MASILSLDTSAQTCSVALLHNHVCLHAFETCPRQQSQRILPAVYDILNQANRTLSDLDAIAVSQGPGSFTGVRLGISVAQGLAYGAQLPVIPISTLQAVAWSAYQKHPHPVDAIVVALDARMNEVYYGVFDPKTYEPLQEEIVTPISNLASLVASYANQSIVAAGNGFGLKEQNAAFDGLKVMDIALMPDAKAIAYLASQSSKKACNPKELAPVYIRNQVIQNR